MKSEYLKIKGKWKILASLCLALSFAFAAACGGPASENSSNADSSASAGTSTGEQSERPTSDSSDTGSGESSSQSSAEEVPEVVYDTSYAPTLFDAESVSFETSMLSEGVRLVKNTFSLNNGNVSAVYTLEIDLKKAEIHAGNTDNVTVGYTWKKSVPNAQALAWEKATGRQVLASINADFFGDICVNAFVKDGVILKAGHNDKGVYDYRDDAADVPASAPMLFGLKDGKAQIGPIVGYTGDVTSAEVKKTLVQAKLVYQGKLSRHTSKHVVEENVAPAADAWALLTSGTYKVPSGSVVLKLDISEGYGEMAVLEKTTLTKLETYTPESGCGYLVMHPDYTGNKSAMRQSAVGDTVSLAVTSPDGKWDGFDTILGCRQALVTDGEIPDTVALENSNGAQTTDIPRTSIGIKKDGTVVLFAVESMRYGKKSTSDEDTYGLNLPEIAQFIRFYGCPNAANFDGGGSTQLIVRQDGQRKVLIRSSDTGSYDLDASRPVMNTFLIAAKEGN